MRVAVVGGTGTLGSVLVETLLSRGEQVRILSRGSTAKKPISGASFHRVDLSSGEGLESALDGVEAVIDAANSQKQAGPVLVDGTRRLLAAGAEAGVRHHLTVSIVGCDRVPLGYYRAKVEQEEALAAGSVPWSLLRATQFHSLLGTLLGSMARWGLRPTGAARLQPIDPAVVAGRLADAVRDEPGGRLPDLAGPEVRTLGELSEAWQRAHGRRLLRVRVPTVGKLGRSLREGALCNPGASTPGPSFEQWLADG